MSGPLRPRTEGELLRWTGPAASAVALGGIGLAALASPSFAPAGNALSNLGVATTDAGTPLTALLFNGALVGGGLPGAGFAWWRWQGASGPGGRLVAVLLSLAVVAMAGVGLFPQDTLLHLPAAVALYLLVSLLLWTDGWVSVRRGERQRGGVAALLGAANAVGWAAWVATGPVQRPGVAIPESVGAVVFAAWVVFVALHPGGGLKVA